jgi:hypothetical protein
MNGARAPFFRRAHLLALAAAGASLLLAVVHLVFEEDLDVQWSNGANSFSASALGHKGFLALLGERGIEQEPSRFRTASRVEATDVLLLAEPDSPPELATPDATAPPAEEPASRARRDRHAPRLRPPGSLAKAQRVLLVLPRFRPAPDDVEQPRRHLRNVVQLDAAQVEHVLESVVPDATIVRLDAPPHWTVNGLALEPDLPHPQLFRAENVRPVIACDEGILVGELGDDDRLVLVCADPTPFENHGLWRGENAALALALIESLRGAQGRVVVDEVLHGFELVPSALREVFRRPLLWITLDALALALLAVWAAVPRFGRPLPAPRGRVEGKQALLDNVGELFDVIGATPHALRRYFDATVSRIVATRHAPADLPRAKEAEWLASRLPLADVQVLAELDDEIHALRPERRRDRPALLELARRIHRFRTEMVDGPR